MKKQAYFKQITFFVRWRLPKREADEVLADYAEILSQRPENNDTALMQELGPPFHAARMLTDPNTYRRWLAAFGGMVLCLLLPELLLLRTMFYQEPTAFLAALLAFGTVISLIWFRPRRAEEKTPLPKGVLTVLLGLLMLIVVSGLVLASLFAGVWTHLAPGLYGTTARWTLWLCGSVAAIAGLFGLVKARTADRRWRALYVMGLHMLVACVMVIAVLTSMRIDTLSFHWWVPYAVHCGVVGLTGLVCTGVSLC